MFNATAPAFRFANAGYCWYCWWCVREACGGELN